MFQSLSPMWPTRLNHRPCSSWWPAEIRTEGPNCDIYSFCLAVVLKQRGNVAVTLQKCLCNIWFGGLLGEKDVNAGAHTLALISLLWFVKSVCYATLSLCPRPQRKFKWFFFLFGFFQLFFVLNLFIITIISIIITIILMIVIVMMLMRSSSSSIVSAMVIMGKWSWEYDSNDNADIIAHDFMSEFCILYLSFGFVLHAVLLIIDLESF